MMVGEGPYEAESHMLIDFDNSAWGYRGFDFNMHFAIVSYTSNVELLSLLGNQFIGISSKIFLSSKTFQKMTN